MNTWTNHEIERLRALHAQGLSCAKIAADLPPQPTSSGISLFDMGYGQCRWPLNDVNPISEFRFCGAKSEGSWCETHKALGWAKR